MRYAIIDADTNDWLNETDVIFMAHEQLRVARKDGKRAMLVQVLIAADEDEVPDVFAGMFDDAV